MPAEPTGGRRLAAAGQNPRLGAAPDPLQLERAAEPLRRSRMPTATAPSSSAPRPASPPPSAGPCRRWTPRWSRSTEVETAARRRLPIVSVILDNSSLAWIKHSAASRYPGGMVSEDFIEVSYAEAGRALGASAARVSTLEQFEAAFETALFDEADRPWVIEATTCDIGTPVLPSPTGGPVTGGY